MYDNPLLIWILSSTSHKRTLFICNPPRIQNDTTYGRVIKSLSKEALKITKVLYRNKFGALNVTATRFLPINKFYFLLAHSSFLSSYSQKRENRKHFLAFPIVPQFFQQYHHILNLENIAEVKSISALSKSRCGNGSKEKLKKAEKTRKTMPMGLSMEKTQKDALYDGYFAIITRNYILM